MLDGNAKDETGGALFCLWPGDDAVTSAEDLGAGLAKSIDKLSPTIAAQCCTVEGVCRRTVSEVDGSCIGGEGHHIGHPRDTHYLTPMTYAQAVGRCAGLGLVMCNRSCVGEGCNYNEHPVWPRAAHGAPPHRAPPVRCTAESVHRV